MGPVKNEFAFLRVVLMQRPAIARREEGAYRQYSVRHEGAEGQWMRDPPE